MLCALLDNNIIFTISDLTEGQIQSSTHQVVDISLMDPQPVVGWILQGNKLVPPAGQTATPSMKISKLALLNRFTNTELATYYTAIQSNIGLLILDKKLFAAEYIDLNRADTIYGINVLASASVGIITSARATAILTNPVTEVERHKGT
ncbi:MAG: hypothetical protein IPQ08_06135 [Chitinophagaceae bacterium]|nr:hypothetical protein [Chitinophagaceae bacterium]